MSAAIERARGRLRSWRENPAQFAYENFGDELDEWQVDTLNALGGDYQPIRRVGMKACTGPGKTRVLGIAGWHRLSCYGGKGKHPKGAALSITKDNLKDNLWPEMNMLQQRSEFLKSTFTATKERIYSNDHPETWFLSARSFAKDADETAIGNALSGLHGPFPFILLDEIGDMPTAVGRKSEQIFTGSPVDAAIIAAGNPTSVTGLLYEICTQFRTLWSAPYGSLITITADPDDPKRTPRVPIDFARQQIKTYGKDNPWIMATILGLFPSIGFNSLVGIEDLEAAMKRHYRTDQYDFAAKIIGCDVAREGDDLTVFAPRQGLVGFKPRELRNQRSNIVGTALAQSEEKWNADGVIVDGTGGYGSGVIDFGTNIGRTWFDCQFAGKSPNPKFANMRAFISWEFAEWIKNGGALPYLPRLIKEAMAITYTYQGDKILIKPKELIKKEIGISTDYWDAYATTFAYPIAKRKSFPWQVAAQGGEYDPVARAQEMMKQSGNRGEYDVLARG